jgi:hypothetical protein
LSLGAIVALAGAVAWATAGSDGDSHATREPHATPAPAPAPVSTPTFQASLDHVDFDRFTLHWLEDFATLAPPGLAVVQQGLSAPSPPAATKQVDELNAALAADRGGVYAGTFSVPATASRSVAPVISGATGSYAAYHSPATAHAAFEAARKFATGGRGTASANKPIALAPNAATSAFGFRTGPAKHPTFTAVLEFPGSLIQLSTTSANADQLTGMIAVVTSWAR